jgi:DNA replication licensing factor MCM6
MLRLRELKTGRLGHLISMMGTVTRTSEVRPELVAGSFTCLECRVRSADVAQQFKYTEVRPLPVSDSADCFSSAPFLSPFFFI